MKRILILTAALMVTFLALPVHAQISWGGEPFSFNDLIKEPPPTVTLPVFNVATLLAEDEAERRQARPRPPRFAKAVEVSFGLDNAGVWTTLPTQDRLWRLRIFSPGAHSLSLIFDEFYMPEGATFYVYSENRKTVLGAFTSANNKPYGKFSTAPIEGGRIILEYYEPSWARGKGKLLISKVAHAYRKIFEEGGGTNFSGHGNSSSCNINVNCSQGSAWQDEKHAVTMVLLSNQTRLCSGALVNNKRQDDTPYFLTAFHCADTNGNGSLSSTEKSNAQTWIFMFNYESLTCTNADGPTWQTLSGATFRAAKRDSDFLLMELSTVPSPFYYPYYAGWSRSSSASTSTVGIHHPQGDIKKISIDNDSAVSSRWTVQGYTSPANSHWEVYFDNGTVEHGSSGSPLFDQNSRIVGQLQGNIDPNFNENNYCDVPHAWYGKFSMSWSNGSSSSTRLKDWLDPDNTGPTTLNGKYGIIPPEPPTNLVITNASQINGSPQLSWTASPSSNVSHYEIYRCPSYYRNCFTYGSTIATTTSTAYTDFDVIITTQSNAYDRFSYKVQAISNDDVASGYTNWASVWGDTFHKRGPSEEETLPEVFALEQNYPNPFNPQTEIGFALAEAAQVSLTVYDASGREVAHLVDGFVEAGYHRVLFNGAELPSGIYLYRLRAGDVLETKRMTLIK